MQGTAGADGDTERKMMQGSKNGTATLRGRCLLRTNPTSSQPSADLTSLLQ
jgi:hypothetical protein